MQSFIHLEIEKKYPEFKNKFDIFIPSSTIFNISPKNFFDYYRLTGGRIIGMTGTAGSLDEIKEFYEINKILTFNFPSYDTIKRSIKEETVNNLTDQYSKVDEILSKFKDSKRPIIIFVESIAAAEEVFDNMQHHRPGKTHLFALSKKNTVSTEKELLHDAGMDGYLTIVTPMLGRGTDFKTFHSDGFLGINLCTNITISKKLQIYGRVARNGYPGEIISIFNKEFFDDDIDNYMNKLSAFERDQRNKARPPTDILIYFNFMNQNNAENAIKCYDFVMKEWDNLIDNQSKNDQIDYDKLENELINILKIKYPHMTNNLDNYLKLLNTDYFDEKNYNNNNIDYVTQKYNNDLFNLSEYKKLHHYSDWNFKSIYETARSISVKLLKANTEYEKLIYNFISQVQLAIINTHVFSLENNQFKFKLYNETNEINGEGEGFENKLMLYEFKKSFTEYQKFVNNKRVDQIANLINNFEKLEDINLYLLDTKKYQAIRITTQFTEESGHIESILTNGKILFWINRGGGSEKEPGIKIFKITKNMHDVKNALNWLKQKKRSQTETIEKIYSLLKKNKSNKELPRYLFVNMSKQTIGNCGWAQTESMIKAVSLLNELNNENIDITKDEIYKSPEIIKNLIESQKWQKALKISEEIYQDFIKFNKIRTLEFTISNIDKNPDNPITYDLFNSLFNHTKKEQNNFIDTIYDKEFNEISDKLNLYVEMFSDAGKSLQRTKGEFATKIMLEFYQSNKQNNFSSLDKIYEKIKRCLTKNEKEKDELFAKTVECIITPNCQLLNEEDIELKKLIEELKQKTTDGICIGRLWATCNKNLKIIEANAKKTLNPNIYDDDIKIIQDGLRNIPNSLF